ncbi:MAG: transporter, family, sialic acid transporter, partial [Streptomycetaceae bacterium]|nr:transporter, family, sialic acid transporter [Streptomycetaceae bacterium]
MPHPQLRRLRPHHPGAHRDLAGVPPLHRHGRDPGPDRFHLPLVRRHGDRRTGRPLRPPAGHGAEHRPVRGGLGALRLRVGLLVAVRVPYGHRSGQGREYAASATYVLESWPDRLRNKASGILLSGYPLGAVLAAKCCAWIVPHADLRVLFWLGVLPVVLAIYLRGRLPEARERRESSERERPVSVTAVLFTGRRSAWNAPIGAAAALGVFLVLRHQSLTVTLLLVALVTARFIAFAVQFAGRLWPVTVVLMVTHSVVLWVLLFCLQGTGQGASGVLPKYVSGHFPVGFRAAGLGFTYNVGALGGCRGARTRREARGTPQPRHGDRGAGALPDRGGDPADRLRRPGTGAVLGGRPAPRAAVARCPQLPVGPGDRALTRRPARRAPTPWCAAPGPPAVSRCRPSGAGPPAGPDGRGPAGGPCSGPRSIWCHGW